MDSSSQASCSGSWSSSSGSHTSSDIQQIHEMKLKNEHLQELVKQLQSTLETTKGQLQTALSTATAANEKHEEVLTLKLKLKETNEQCNQKIKEMKTQMTDLCSKSEEDKRRLTGENEALSKELQKAKQTLRETQKERNALADELIETKQQMKCVCDKASKLSKRKTKQHNQLLLISQQRDDCESKYNALCLIHEQLIQENKTRDAHYETLNEEMDTLKSKKSELFSMLESSKEENKDLSNAMEIIQQQMETQKEDIMQLIEQREKILLVIQKLHSLVCVYEDELESAKSQNIALKDKSKKANAFGPRLLNEQINFESISFPFDGEELKNKIKQISSYDHFQPTQKLQLVINEVAKEMEKMNQKTEESNKEKESASQLYQDIKTKYQKTGDMLNSVMREWKNLECNEEKIDVIAFCEKDNNFLEFLAEECTKLDNLTEAAEFLGPLFVSSGILSGENSDQRKKFINEVASTNKELSTLISAMFLINTRLKSQVNELIDGSNMKSEVTSVLKALGVEQIRDVPSFIEEMQKQMVHLKSTRKEVHMALVSARDSLSEKEKHESELVQEIRTLNQKISTLTTDNDNLQKEAEKTRRIIESNNSIVNETNKALNSCQTTISTNENSCDVQDTIRNLQELIQNKTKENNALTEQFAKLKEETDQMNSNRMKKFSKKKQSLLAHIKELEEALTDTSAQFVQAKKKARNAINVIKSQASNEIAQNNMKFEQSKVEMQTELIEAKDRAEKAKLMINQLQDSLTQAERKNKEIVDDNSKLNKMLQALEMKVNSIQEQLARDQKTAQAATTVKILNVETQHQKETKEIKNKLENEKQKAINFFTQHLGALYGIIDLDFDEMALTQLFSRLQSDLVKLRFFQDQATKY